MFNKLVQVGTTDTDKIVSLERRTGSGRYPILYHKVNSLTVTLKKL